MIYFLNKNAFISKSETGDQFELPFAVLWNISLYSADEKIINYCMSVFTIIDNQHKICAVSVKFGGHIKNGLTAVIRNVDS